jgi:hypothetical protein
MSETDNHEAEDLNQRAGRILKASADAEYERATAYAAAMEVIKARSATGLAAVYGKWPGDETEEQIMAALKELDLGKPAA